MAAYKDGKRWRYRMTVALANGTRTKISGTPAINTKAQAEHEERLALARVLNEGPLVGRRPAAGEARERRITVRATDAEERAWQEIADSNGITLGEWMRRVLNVAAQGGS